MKKIFPILLFSSLLFSCVSENVEELYPTKITPLDSAGNPVVISFATDIQPLFVSRCTNPGCHTTPSSQGGHAPLNNYTEISSIATKINNRVVVQKNMPQGSSMPQVDIDKVSSWINNGAPNN